MADVQNVDVTLQIQMKFGVNFSNDIVEKLKANDLSTINAIRQAFKTQAGMSIHDLPKDVKIVESSISNLIEN